ncbi:MAG: ATP-dependent RNA helicase [Opitutales bacterium]|nr:ATP-dependent RNA helicase [Opitutales bacterium]
MKPPAEPLPVDALEPEIRAALATHRRFVLSAPTGSGKSTRVPRMLAAMPGLVDGTVIILQPRRIAARMLAKRVAREADCDLGDAVGYHVRFDNRSGKNTRVLFVTEGLLLRRLAEDRDLNGVGALLFDEFHERHLDGDVSLALARQLQAERRPDLVLGVMSATLDVETLAERLAPCATFHTEGRVYPVDIRYSRAVEVKAETPAWERAARAFRKLGPEVDDGHILVFMPGAYEIRRTLDALRETPESRRFALHALHGELPPDAQDAALEAPERQKVIVSTNIAETSLTIDGVRAVVDSGLARIPAFDPGRGINTLLIEKISRASADQRAGRAGRTGPGVCLRLWTEAEHAHRPAALEPEITRLDLSETALLLANALSPEALDTLPWVEPPPPDAWQRARQLLADLGALDPGTAGITDLGRLMARFPLHPRWSRLLLAAHERGVLPAAALLAAVCQDRSLILPLNDRRREEERAETLLRAGGTRSDLFPELNAWQALRGRGFDHDFARHWGLHAQRARVAGHVADQLLNIAERSGLRSASTADPADVEDRLRVCLLLAFADHLAMRLDRSSLRCALVHGRRGEIARQSLVRDAPLLVATELQERGHGHGVSLLLSGNTEVEEAWLSDFFPGEFRETAETRIDPQTRRAVATRQTVFRGLVLREESAGKPDPEAAARLFAAGVERGEFTLKSWDAAVERWIGRVNFLAAVCPDYGFAHIGPEERRFLVEQICHGVAGYKELKDKDVWPFLRDWLPAGLNSEIDRLAPERMELPGKGRARLRYEDDGTAVLSARIQQLYDVPHKTLAVAEGRVLPKIELLAPNQRPVQITADLDAFWETSYAAVRKDLRGRYPKHEWR